MFGTQRLASATALMRGQSLPPSEMKSLYGSMTSRAVNSSIAITPAYDSRGGAWSPSDEGIDRTHAAALRSWLAWQATPPAQVHARMDASLDSAADEVARLRRCLNDLVCIMALPALWAGGEPRRIVSTLLDTLLDMLQLEFAFAQ